MPATVNGIGTTYYGKKNLQVRTGTCGQCGKVAKLSTYDTRLYFVVIFIPIIPLARKHIIDYCSLCSRHRVADLKDWEKLRGNAIEEGMKAVRENPSDPRAAMELHQAYIGFDQTADADKMMAHLKDNFPADFNVHMYLGAALESRGRGTEANECFKQALAIDLQNLAAQRAVGMVLLEEKNLNDGAKMLARFTQDDAGYDIGAAYALAKSYKDAQRNADALELFKIIAKRSPVMKKDPIFKNLVRATEKSLGQQKSILPPKAWHESNWMPAYIGIGVLLLVVGFSTYMSYHRKVFVVSGAKNPIVVSIQGGPTVTVTSNAPVVSIELAEGPHTVTYSGGATGTQTFTVEGNFFYRMTFKEMVCLNAGNSAVLLWEQTVYSKAAAVPDEYKLYFGEPIFHIHSVDHHFEPFPASISTKNSSETHTRVGLMTYEKRGAFITLYTQGRTGEAMDFAEWYVSMHPDDSDFAQLYMALAFRDQDARVRAFAAKRYAARPIEVIWHRIHQDIATTPKERAVLLTEYDALLAADKENPDLLYLRGRLCATGSESQPYLSQVLAKDPKHGFALLSSAFHKVHRAEWDDAWALAQRALTATPKFARPLYIDAAYGSKHFKELEAFLSAENHQQPNSGDAAGELCSLLASQGRDADAQKISDAYVSVMQQQRRKFVNSPRAEMYYAAGNFRELDKATANDNDLLEWRAVLAQEADDLAQLEMLTAKEDADNPFDALLYGLSFKIGGRTELASKWRENALKGLSGGREEGPIVQKWLQSSDAPSIDSVMDLSLENRSLTIVLAVLAEQFPAQRGAYLAALNNVNVVPKPPYHWLKRLATKLNR